ncbi:MAG TPA: methyltransferase domain-containing protein [Kofleriaceae bacterium]|nr:methyltransferase domain-containing protein [Kofleriaceae bacterium]
MILRGAALLERLRSIPSADRDAWVDDLLAIGAPPPDVALPRGAVPYLPCGVDEIITAILEAPVRDSDVLVDLGSGLGRVAILGHLLSGARTWGIEIQEHLVERARARVSELQLDDVSFIHGNAEDIVLDGSVFFLYAPFNGPMLARVVEQLEHVARRRPIIVCAVHLELHDIAWLAARPSSCGALTIYDSVFAR